MAWGSTTWSLGEEDFRFLQDAVAELVRQTDSRAALLVERSGQLVMTVGERLGFDAVTFSSLAAADFAANDQFATLIGEPDFSTLYHQGDRDSVYLADLAKRFILIVLFDQRTTLGLVRIKTRRVTRHLTAYLRESFDRTAAGPPAHVETGWVAEAEYEIDRVFREG